MSTILVISIWRRKLCSPSTIPSGQKCYLCLRYILLSMCRGRTLEVWLPVVDAFRTFCIDPGPEGATLLLEVQKVRSGIAACLSSQEARLLWLWFAKNLHHCK